jgi:amino acid permease
MRRQWTRWAPIWLALTFVGAATTWADHPGALRSDGWTPLTAALVFGGLALLAGMVVIVIVTLLTRRDDGSS